MTNNNIFIIFVLAIKILIIIKRNYRLNIFLWLFEFAFIITEQLSPTLTILYSNNNKLKNEHINVLLYIKIPSIDNALHFFLVS